MKIIKASFTQSREKLITDPWLKEYCVNEHIFSETRTEIEKEFKKDIKVEETEEGNKSTLELVVMTWEEYRRLI